MTDKSNRSLISQNRATEKKSIYNGYVSIVCTPSDPPRVKKLKRHIFLLRVKSKVDGIKIKSLQNQIRRLSRKLQDKNAKKIRHTPSRSAMVKKRKNNNSKALSQLKSSQEQIIETLTLSMDSAELVFSNGNLIDKIDFSSKDDSGMKPELIEYELDHCNKSVSEDGENTASSEEEILTVVVKAEPEEDPLNPNY